MFLIKYWKLIGIGISVLALFGALFYYGHTKYREGYDKAFNACEAQKQRTIDANYKTWKKQTIILPLGDIDLADSLRGDTF